MNTWAMNKGVVMKKFIILCSFATLLSACNTLQGIGKDIEKGGEAIQNSTK